ncbi:MAG: glycosyltransferase [Ferruginibacter sp.]
MSKFSIILPVHNGGCFFRICIEGILGQSYSDFELIILDNNSTDGTFEWINSIADNRIKVYRSEKDLSMTENWARIVEIKKNEFMTIIGHDDLFHPGYLEKMNELISKYPDASLYQAHFNFIDAGGQLLNSSKPMPATMSVQGFLEAEFMQRMDSMGTGYMMRSSDYDRMGGIDCSYPNLIFADYQLWTELAGLNFLAISPETCFSYRLHNSVSKTTDAENYRIAFEKYLGFLSSYAQNRPAVKKAIKANGNAFLNYFCESLSHRLLKSPKTASRIPVHTFIENCKKNALLLEISNFRPYRKFPILLAAILDSNFIFRKIFMLVKRKGMA